MELTRSTPRSAWWTAVVCGFASYIDAAAVISLGTAVVIYEAVFNLSAGEVGGLSAVLTLGIAVGAIVGGRLGDRFGRKPVFTLTMILIAVGAAILVFGDSFGVLVVGATLVGLGAGGDLPVSLATIAEAADDHNRGRLVSLSNVLWIVGGLSGTILGVLFGNLGRLGAQILFLHVLVATVIVMIARLTIPESQAWRDSRAKTPASGEDVEGGTKAPSLARQLFTRPYAVPFFALVFFYSLVNLVFNTTAQFGPYLLVTEAGLDVSTAASFGLIMIPVLIVGYLWFMRISEFGGKRFRYFTIGAVILVAGLLVPVVFGFSAATYLIAALLGSAGAAFAGETIMKVWTQEQFPTLLRATAQGAIISVARFVAAGFASVTPLIITSGASLLYALLAAISALGLGIAWAVFKTADRHTEFRLQPTEAPVTQ